MKLLFCSPSFKNLTHGPAVFLNHILNSDLSLNHEIHLLLPEEEYTQVSFRSFLYKLKEIKRIKGFGNYAHSKFLNNKILKLSNLYNYDLVVFFHGLLSYHTSKNLIKNFKTLCFINDDDLLLRKSIFNINSKNALFSYLNRNQERYAVRNSDLVVTPSVYLKNLVLKEYQNDSINKSLYQGTKNPEFKNTRYNLDYTKTIEISFIKADFKRGGIYLLIEALKSIVKYSFKLNIIGPQKSIWDKQKNKIDISKNTNIIFHGPVSRNQTLELIKNSHLVCIPSLREGLGVANIEALSLMTPVVSTNVGGIPEVLDFGKGGWIAELNSSDLANKITKCIENKKDRITKCEHGYKHYLSNFRIEVQVEKFYKILESTI